MTTWCGPADDTAGPHLSLKAVSPIEITNTKYTTLDREMTFTFDFVQSPNGTWRVYIVDRPSYEGRSDTSVTAHWLSDHRGRYICWTTPLTTLDAAKGVARVWADATQVYIRTGRFPPPGPDREVPDWSSSANWQHRTETGLFGSQGTPTTPRSPGGPPEPRRPSRTPRGSSYITQELVPWRTLR